MATQERRGGGLGFGLIVLLVLAALGGWNYHRNWQAERGSMQQRPFMTYDRSSLEQLVAAYESDLANAKRRSGGRAAARANVRDTALLGEAVDEFDRVSRVAAQRRDATASIAQHEARLAQVRVELARRTPTNAVLTHVQRLTGFALTN